jgi:hypothetical protein
MIQQQPEMLDMYRAGLKGAVDLMKASLENAERLQNQQLAMIRQALDAQAASVAELANARTMDELMAVQTRLAGAQIERAVGFWFGQMQTQMTQAREWFSQAALQSQASVRQAEKASTTAARR